MEYVGSLEGVPWLLPCEGDLLCDFLEESLLLTLLMKDMMVVGVREGREDG
jgi:hypothetical protein